MYGLVYLLTYLTVASSETHGTIAHVVVGLVIDTHSIVHTRSVATLV